MSDTTDTRTPVINEVLPYLCVRGGAQAIEFYVHVFGATEKLRPHVRVAGKQRGDAADAAPPAAAG